MRKKDCLPPNFSCQGKGVNGIHFEGERALASQFLLPAGILQTG